MVVFCLTLKGVFFYSHFPVMNFLHFYVDMLAVEFQE